MYVFSTSLEFALDILKATREFLNCSTQSSFRFDANEARIVDKCKKNHGIWFDKGELQKVVEFGSVNKENKIINLLKDMFENSSQNNGGSK